MRFSKKNIVTQLLYLILYFIVSIGSLMFLKYALPYTFINFDTRYYAYAIYLANILVGAVLGINVLYDDMSKPGTISIKWERILIVGIPVFLASTYNALYFNFHTFPFLASLIMRPNTTQFFQIILGYVIITSFKRTKA